MLCDAVMLRDAVMIQRVCMVLPWIQIYHWSGLNDFFIKGDKDSFMLGGGE